ncbi:alpha-ketoglutarate-dependent dioxygenase AlkB [Marinimicrobium sp. ABcell2]|uniref:alpha-ketoglutarate-dependent dioxygenase AlkB family protein n=1 Tax=Marinimicrobium sp. ABcell2 TaxID=3069751 RepID=UPI0027B6DC8B|nr:alpha-ketoglutarate-dependent dioxygenase AlkB [Marinimicrobium sp. ABcell2]MDQ2078367.1 alpha-ketoglutarate-dependent dioxygenase AlkB [Marinimicrobium sp. ABcell2]
MAEGHQPSLFETLGGDEPELLVSQDGDVRLYRQWFDSVQADDYFRRLHAELAWQQTIIRMHGRKVPVPRLDVWYGDPGHRYRYSGVDFDALPWTPTLAEIKHSLEARLGHRFNSVLANLYRDGRDSVAWHSDDEPELGANPVIASVSLGATRRFSLRHKARAWPTVRQDLPNGSVLLMAGATQHHWQHQLAKTARTVGPRINLTFRSVFQ